MYGIIFDMKTSLKGLLSGIFGSKTDTYVGIDIGSAYIKVAQLRKTNGRIVLETYGEVALGPYEDRFEGELTNLPSDKLAEALKNLLDQANVTATEAVISVSSATSLIFILKLPNISNRELTGMVNNEARKYIPIPLSEVSLDWWMIPEKEVYGDDEGQERGGNIDVLVAVVRNEVIDKYNQVNNLLGRFTSPAYEIETFSAIRGSFKRELAPVILLDTGAAGTRVSVVEHGVVRKFHVINRGSAYLTNSIAKSLEIEFEDAEELKREVGLDKNHEKQEIYNIISAGVNFVFSEIQSVIYDYEKEYKKPIRKIILTGGGSMLKNYRETLESKYNITTEYADPFDKAASPEFLEEVLDKAGPEFAVAIGLALQGIE
jgi:type IV pilus assembly protein PilM